jgi:uncharacterized protein YggE
MLKRGTVVLLAVLTVAVAGAETGKIRASATADLFAPPDVAQVVFSVTSEDPVQAQAEAKQAAQVKEILEAIQGLKLPKLVTRTPPSQTTKQEAWPPPGAVGYGGTPRKAGYVVGTVIEVGFDGDPATLERGLNQVMTIAQTHGAMNVVPDTACRGLEAVRQKALAAATKAAVERAQAMAKAAGVHIAGYSYIGPCPETARQWYDSVVVNKGPMGFGGGYGGRGGGSGGVPIIEIHNTQVSATVWVTATY